MSGGTKDYSASCTYWPASGRLGQTVPSWNSAVLRQQPDNNLKILLHTCQNSLNMLLDCNGIHCFLYDFVFGKVNKVNFPSRLKKHFLQDGSQTSASQEWSGGNSSERVGGAAYLVGIGSQNGLTSTMLDLKRFSIRKNSSTTSQHAYSG